MELYIDNLKCCGNCAHYSEHAPETCGMTDKWVTPEHVCDVWEFDSHYFEERNGM